MAFNKKRAICTISIAHLLTLSVTSPRLHHVKSMSNLNVNRILNYSPCSLALLTYPSARRVPSLLRHISEEENSLPFSLVCGVPISPVTEQ